MAIDLGNLMERAKNSLDHDLASLAAFTAIAGGISELPENTELPETSLFFTFGFGLVAKEGKIIQHPLFEEVRKNFSSHSSRYAVLGMVTAFSVYLERLLWITMLINHALNRSEEITNEKMEKLHQKAERISQANNPEQMLQKITEQLSLKVTLKSSHRIRSIYKMRNILSHRGGIVSSDDVDQNSEVRLIWQTIEIGQRDDGSGVLRFVDTEKVLKISDELKISPKECQEIAFSLGNCQQDLATLIVENAQRLSKKSNP